MTVPPDPDLYGTRPPAQVTALSGPDPSAGDQVAHDGDGAQLTGRPG